MSDVRSACRSDSSEEAAAAAGGGAAATGKEDIPPEKVVAPFLRTLRKRREIKADLIHDDCKEFYLRENPQALLLKLEESFAEPLKLATILNETAELLRAVTNSKSVNLYLTNYEQKIITLCPRYLQGNDRFLVKYRIEPGTTLAAYVAHTKDYVFSPDILGDARFPEGIPGTDRTIKAALCVPVLSSVEDTCIAVIELYRDFRQPTYSTVDLQITVALTGWVGVGVQQNTARLRLVKEVEIHRYLLSLTQLYFENVITYNKALSDLLVFSRTAVRAEKCVLLLMDYPVPYGSQEVLYADVYEEGIDASVEQAVFRRKQKARFEYMKPGVPGYVARSGEVIVIRDTLRDDRFDENTDPMDYRTRSMLAAPIKNVAGVLGVFKLMNKLSDSNFTEEDVHTIAVFCQYAALIREFEDLFQRFKQEDVRLVIAKNLLLTHIKPPPEDLAPLKSFPVLSAQQMPTGFTSFGWDSSLYEEEIPKYIIFVFLGSDLFGPRFEHHNVISFTLSVKKACRPLAHHNFDHAFNSFHFLYNVLVRNREKFTVVEMTAMLVAALCHDVDHQGLTSSFLELKNDPIAQLYEDFPMEQHSFYVCSLILQATNLLSKFSESESSEIMSEVERLILATSLSFYFHSKKALVELVNEGSFTWGSESERRLMKGFLMIAADFSFNYRTFDLIRKNVDSYYKEMYQQGDTERSLGLSPVTVMDRTHSSLMPDYHTSLLTLIVVPCLEVVCGHFSECEEALNLCRDGFEKWKELIQLRGVEVWKPDESYMKEKKARGHRNTVLSNWSSGKSVQSDQKSMRLDN